VSYIWHQLTVSDTIPTLLLSVTGRKSGLTRTTALVYFEDGGNYVVVGSDGAARRDPQWWKNLRVNPQATVRVGRNKFAARASLATGAERERLGRSVQVSILCGPNTKLRPSAHYL
jgi:deazaflavin-dependent oxidoreductase (nitroreductase family)